MEQMFLPYKRYAQFSGRSARSEYWLFVLFEVIVLAIGFALMLAGGFSLYETPSAGEIGVLFYAGIALIGVFGLASFIPAIAVAVRRFHDRDMSGWWVLGFAVLGSLPYVGGLFSLANLVIMALPGTPGTNRFGPDPKDPLNTDVFG